VSKAVLLYVNPQQHEFRVDLHKEDGWFDTGIPVTADIGVLEFCLSNGAAPCGGWIQAMIGGTVFHPFAGDPNNQIINLATFLAGQDLNRSLYDQTAQFLPMPGQAAQTLKLRIAGDNAPDELRQVMIKINVRPKDINLPQQFTAPQQLEQVELAKWVKQ
jgi:hypothetical protein